MKQAAFLLGAILVYVATGFAQDNSANALFSPSPAPEMALAGSSPTLTEPPIPASPATPANTDVSASPALGSNSPSEPPAPKSNVYRVFQTYNLQLYAGYAFFRFYALPNRKENMNGIDLGVAYYPKAPWIGADGDILVQFGGFLNQSSRFIDYMGGPRFRWLGPRNLELWAHGLVGYAKFVPQTALGSQNAFSYEAGGGVDLGIPRRRLAYRVQADMVGTKFFHSYQLSPKISFGIVFKF